MHVLINLVLIPIGFMIILILGVVAWSARRPWPCCIGIHEWGEWDYGYDSANVRHARRSCKRCGRPAKKSESV